MDASARFSSRKFWVVEQVLVMSFILALVERLTQPWGMIVSVAVGAYITGNTVIATAKIKANGNG